MSTQIAIAGADGVSTLLALVDRAAAVLAGARTHAEVLEARNVAASVVDATKSFTKLAKRKQAADELIAAAYRIQADALEIEAQAKRRLADEYDAAQERGEVLKHGQRPEIGVTNLSQIGVSPNEIFEARIIQEAEQADPGIIRRSLDDAIAKGEEPTRSILMRAAETKSTRKRKRHKRPDYSSPNESQHDRDLRMLTGVWEAACESARREFLRTVNP